MGNEDIKNQIISEIQRIANELGKTTFSRSEFSQLSKISLHQVYNNFNGWNDAILKAGLIPDETRNKKLMKNCGRIYTKFVTNWIKFQTHAIWIVILKFVTKRTEKGLVIGKIH